MLTITAQRIVVYRRGSVADDDIALTGVEMPRLFRKRDRASAHCRINPGSPLHQPRRITGRYDSELGHGSVCTRLERGQQLLVNAVEAAVRHHNHEISIAGFLADRADDVGHLRNVTRFDATGLKITDQGLW